MLSLRFWRICKLIVKDKYLNIITNIEKYKKKQKKKKKKNKQTNFQSN